MLRINFGIIEAEAVNIGTTLKERFEAHVEVQTAGGNKGVSAVNHLDALHREVERKRKAHAADTDVHACRFRERSGHAVHHKVLHGRQIKQHGEQEKKNEGRQEYAYHPLLGFMLDTFLHSLN